MLGFCPLASGSGGNCVYLGTKEASILIDAGISGKQIKLRLEQIGVKLENIDAVLVTHEHKDHIEGLKILSGKMDIPVLSNAETAKGIYKNLGIQPRFKIFTSNEVFEYKDLEVHPFSIQHDTLDPVGFVIRTQGLKLGFCTDLGVATSYVIKNLEECDYLYLEANHQPSMVHSSNRPLVNKQRVLGRQGHLSNENTAKLLSEIKHAGLKRVYLAHLSSECNNPDLALKIIQQAAPTVDLKIAWQKIVSEAVNFTFV